MAYFTTLSVVMKAGDRLPIIRYDQEKIDLEHGITIEPTLDSYRIVQPPHRVATAFDIESLVDIVNRFTKEEVNT